MTGGQRRPQGRSRHVSFQKSFCEKLNEKSEMLKSESNRGVFSLVFIFLFNIYFSVWSSRLHSAPRLNYELRASELHQYLFRPLQRGVGHASLTFAFLDSCTDDERLQAPPPSSSDVKATAEQIFQRQKLQIYGKLLGYLQQKYTILQKSATLNVWSF